MFSLTYQERKVLLFIAGLILIGSVLRLFKANSADKDLSSPKPSRVVYSAPFNINKASAVELETISGIGGVIAQRIIKYRDEFGPFGSPEDLKKVKGIGDKKLEVIIEQVNFN
jgi:comEA protein